METIRQTLEEGKADNYGEYKEMAGKIQGIKKIFKYVEFQKNQDKKFKEANN